MTTLEKIKRLEEYLSMGSSTVDPVIDIALDKLLKREITRMSELKTRLTDQLKEFEKKYSLSSPEFYARYESGQMGDEMDFVEWAATVEMLTNVEKQMDLLPKEIDS